MKINFKQYCFVACTSLMAGITFAHSQIPSACPDVSKLMSVGVNKAIESEHSWIVIQDNQLYDTDAHWQFIIGKFVADSEQDAIKMANENITKLVLTGANSDLTNNQRHWYCHYPHESDEHIMGVAVSPSLDVNQALAMLDSKLETQKGE